MEPIHESMLNIWDGLAIAVYFILVVTVGLYSMRRSNRSTVAGYFLAGRHMTWLPVGASLFASNIGSEHIIGLAGSGAASGIAVGAFEFNAMFLLQLLGWVFLPVYIASKVSTLPEYLTKRFGGRRLRMYLAVLSLAMYILSKISVNMYSGALFIKEAVGWNLYLSVLLLLAMTTLCTVTGGLAAVIYMDTLQFFIMIFGTTIVMIRSFQAVGGYSALQEKYASAVPNLTIANSTCHQPPSDAWIMLRSVGDSHMPWLGFLIGQTPASIWYFCADQVMVQRALAAKSLSHAQGATLFSGYAKILPFFLIVLPGMISRVLYPDVIGCVVPEECEKYCGSRLGCSNLAYPKLVLGVLPLGLRGVIMAVILAALMSDMTSIFNSSSTLFTIDIWKNIRRSAGPKEMLIVGKIFVVIMVFFSILWIPIIENTQGGQLFIFIQVMTAYLTPPIAAVYLLAVFWKRINEQGAFWSLMLSFVVGIIRMSLDFVYEEPACGDIDERPAFIANVHYMYFAFILFTFTIIICIIISFFTKKPDEFMLIRTTYCTRTDKRERDDDKEDNELNTAVASCCDLSTQVELTVFGERVDASVDDRSRKIPLSRWKIFYFWFCGYEMDLEHEQEKSVAFQKHLQALSSLQQTKKEILILRINLVFIILTGIAIYIYFTLNTVNAFVAN